MLPKDLAKVDLGDLGEYFPKWGFQNFFPMCRHFWVVQRRVIMYIQMGLHFLCSQWCMKLGCGWYISSQSLYEFPHFCCNRLWSWQMASATPTFCFSKNETRIFHRSVSCHCACNARTLPLPLPGRAFMTRWITPKKKVRKQFWHNTWDYSSSSQNAFGWDSNSCS